jgi:hypothetical protein
MRLRDSSFTHRTTAGTHVDNRRVSTSRMATSSEHTDRDRPRHHRTDSRVARYGPTTRPTTPTRATGFVDASVDPTDARNAPARDQRSVLTVKPRRHQPLDRVLPVCFERAGVPLVLREDPPDRRAARAIIFPRPPDNVEADRGAGLTIPLAQLDERLADSLEQDGVVRSGRPVGRPSSGSVRVVQVARGGFRRLCPT